MEDVKGVGFKTADKIASSLGIEADSPNRFRAALMHEVNTHSQSTGDTYIEAKNLLEMTIDLLEEARNVEVNPSAVAEEINGLIVDGKVQQEGTKIFENSFTTQKTHPNNNIICAALSQPLERTVPNISKNILQQKISNTIINTSGKKYNITLLLDMQ